MEVTGKKRFVMVGKSYVNTGKVGVILKEVNEADEVLPEEYYFTASKFAISPAIIYEFDILNDEHSIIPKSAKYIKIYPNKARQIEWNAAVREFDVLHQVVLTGKKVENRNIIRETLGPIRALYLTTNYMNRLALEVLVLNYLRTGEVDAI